MVTETDGHSKCIFQWKIENVSNYWWSKTGVRIVSPVFLANALQDTEWYLSLFDFDEQKNVVGLFLHRQNTRSGPDVIKVYNRFSFLGEDGSILIEGPVFNHKYANGYHTGWTAPKRKRILGYVRSEFLPEAALNIQCAIWVKDNEPAKTSYSLATTTFKLKRRTFLWKIDNISTLKSGATNKYKDYWIELNLILSKNLDRGGINVTSFKDSIKYISCNASIIDSEGRKENCCLIKYLESDLIRNAPITFILDFPEISMENKSQYFPNDVLTLDFEFVFLTVKDSSYSQNSVVLENDVVEIRKAQNMACLIDDLKLLYNEGIFGDMELLTSTKTFPANMFILSARSPIFRSMFVDDMKENNSGQVKITDFDDDTVKRMLLYMYTDSVEGVEFESAIELYKIADKYRILSLKSRCSSFLKQDLCSTNVYDALVLADLYNDDDLKNAARDYILDEGKKIFYSQEWKSFMITHLKLAADVMYRKLTPGQMHQEREF